MKSFWRRQSRLCWNPWHDVAFIRRLRFAWGFREWPWNVPDAVVQTVGTRKPPDYVVDYFRKLHGIDTEATPSPPK